MYSKSSHFITRSFAGLVVIVALLVAPAASPAATISVNDNTLGTATHQFEYSGTWGYASGYPGMYQGDEHYASGASAAYTVRFSGQQVKLYGTVASHHGNAGVSIDGGAEQVVDLYSVIRVEQKLIYTSPTLGAGSHTVRLHATGTKSASSTGTTVTADRVDVIADPTAISYYVDAVAGDDLNNNGTSPATPWRSLGKATSVVLRPATDCFSSAARAGAARSRSTKAAPR